VSQLGLPNCWTKCPTADVATLIRGVTYSKEDARKTEADGYLPILRANNINGTINFDELVFVRSDLISKAQQLRSGDILFAMSSGSRNLVGKSARISRDLDAGFGAFCGVLRPAPEISGQYLSWTYQTREFRHAISELAKGSNINNLKREHLLDYEIPLPPLAEQKRIVAKIEELFSELDAGEESLRRARRQLGIYRQSLLKQAFEGKLTAPWRKQNPRLLESPEQLLSRIHEQREARYEQQLKEWDKAGRLGRKPSAPALISPLTEDERVFGGRLPPEWKSVPAEAMGDVQLGRQRSPQNQSRDYPTKYIRAANITESGLALDDILEMEFSPQERRTFTLQASDLVLSEASGSASQVGKPAMWRGEIPDCCFQNTVIRHRLFDREQSLFYLWLYRFFYLHGIFSRTAGGVGINHLSAGKFSRLPVPLCSLPEQREIVRLLDEQFTVIEQNEREIDVALKRSAALRQSILKKAFTGQLVPQDPTDEPASALLERILNERETASENRKTLENGRRPLRERRGR
jgi:type I restriction enzyme, S subunit